MKREGREESPYRQRNTGAVLLAITLLFSFQGCQEKKLEQEQDKSLEQLRVLVSAKNWDAVEMAKTIGDPSVAVLEASTQDTNEDVRALSVACVAEVRGAQTVQLMLRALADPVLNVRIQAVLGLERHATENETPQLLTYLEKEDEDALRERTTLLIGRLGDTSAVSVLLSLRSKEKDSVLIEKMTWALARLSHKESTQRILSELKAQAAIRRYTALLGVEYLNDPGVAKHLLPLFDDREEVEPDGPAHLGRYRRIRDVVVSVIASITGRKFSFDASERRKFSEKEIDEVRTYLLTL